MSRRFVEQLRDGDSLDDVYLCTDKQLRANRNGNLYLLLELRDRTGGISARLWNAEPQVPPVALYTSVTTHMPSHTTAAASNAPATVHRARRTPEEVMSRN